MATSIFNATEIYYSVIFRKYIELQSNEEKEEFTNPESRKRSLSLAYIQHPNVYRFAMARQASLLRLDPPWRDPPFVLKGRNIRSSTFMSHLNLLNKNKTS